MHPIQKITNTLTLYSGKKYVTTAFLDAYNPNQPQKNKLQASYSYWEAWRVDPDKTTPPASRKYQDNVDWVQYIGSWIDDLECGAKPTIKRIDDEKKQDMLLTVYKTARDNNRYSDDLWAHGPFTATTPAVNYDNGKLTKTGEAYFVAAGAKDLYPLMQPGKVPDALELPSLIANKKTEPGFNGWLAKYQKSATVTRTLTATWSDTNRLTKVLPRP